MNKKWSKVKWSLALVTILLLSAVVHGCASTSDDPDSAGDLVVVSWGGEYQDAQKIAIFEPFQEQTGINVIDLSPVDYAKLKAMVESGRVEWDVVELEDSFYYTAVKEGLIEPLDYSIIDTTGIDPQYVEEYGVASIIGSGGIAYNTESFPAGKHPQSWADVWNVNEFPGVRGMTKLPIFTLEAALLADGVTQDGLYPIDVERALTKLDEIKDHIVWWEAAAHGIQLLVDKEIDLGFVYTGRVLDARDKGAPVEFVWNQGICGTNLWVIPKGAPNKENAMKFINFALLPENQAGVSIRFPYAPSNEKAFEFIPDNVANDLATNPDHWNKMIRIDAEWWGENWDHVYEQFIAWLME